MGTGVVLVGDAAEGAGPDAVGARRSATAPIPALFFLTVVVLFCVSGGMLWSMGLNYDGVSGSAASKIHPSTYLAFLLVAAIAVARGNPIAFVAELPERHFPTLVFAGLTLVEIAFIVLQHRPNLATAVDTYLVAAILLIAMSELDDRAVRRIETTIHLIMAANALLALVEFAVDHRFFPYRFEGETFQLDTRSAALNAHPLVNATLTGCYVVVLLVRGGPALTGGLRTGALALQLAALITFGGRTATVLVAAALLLAGTLRLAAVAAGARLRLRTAVGAAFLLPAGAILLLALGEGGFFGRLIERFVSDGGSASSRIGMLALLGDIPLRDLIVGPDPALVESLRYLNGLEWGIENPIVRTLLYQGALVTGFMVVGFALFMGELGSYLRRGSWPVFLFFLVTINSFESVASKTSLLAKFVVLVYATLARRTAVSARGAGGRAQRPPRDRDVGRRRS